MEANYQLRFSLSNSSDLAGIVKFSNDGELIASVSTESVVELWDAHGGKFQKALSGHNAGINDIAWSHDSFSLLTAGGDKDLKLWDFPSGKCYRTFQRHGEALMCCNFNANSSLMVSGSLDGTVIMWDVRTANPVNALFKHFDAITSVEFNVDGSKVMTTSYDGMCRIWDSASGDCLKTLHTINDGKVFFAKYSRSGEQLLVAGQNALKLWDFSKDQWVKSYSGHQSDVHFISASFSHDGQRIVSGSGDNDIYIWDKKTAQIVQTLQGHTDVVMGVDCHPSVNMIVSVGIESDNTVKFWKTDF